MRYAIVSDLHSNLQAWNAVLLDIRSNRVDHIACLGDVVGYGPSPAEVLESAHENINSFVMGNHDAVICGKLGDSLFNDQAREAIRWTRRRLGKAAVTFLSNCPLMLDGEFFLCTHGDFTCPEAFNYILGVDDADNSWKSVHHQLLFAGHTHEPALYLLGPSGIPRAIAPQDFELEPSKRYLVNVGSVGCSRDSDHRASYCILDTASNAVYWRRIPYDLDAHRKDYERAGLDPASSVVLKSDPRRGAIPLREHMDFAPARSAGETATGVVEVMSIRVLQRRARFWKLSSTLLIVLFGLAGGAFGGWRQNSTVRPVSIHEPVIVPLTATPGTETTNLLPLITNPVPAGSPVPGWTMELGDSRCQSIAVETDPHGTTYFVLMSKTSREEIAITPAPIDVAPGMSFYPDVAFSKSDDFSGTVGIVVSLVIDNGGKESLIQQFYTQEPGVPRSDGWARARRKFVIPAKGRRIELKIGGHFTGAVKIKNITMGYADRSSSDR